MKKKMVLDRQFTVLVEWCYTNNPKTSIEHCYIWPTRKNDYQYDGENYVGHHGNEGMSFSIYDSLETAIVHAQYNPKHIIFQKLNRLERRKKKEILNSYSWDNYKGLIKNNN